MRRQIALLLALLGLCLLAAPASASFHLVKVREVFPGSDPANNAFVELQMYASGQNLVGGHVLHVYGPTGTPFPPFTVVADVAEGGNQRTVLIGDAAVAGADQTVDLGPAMEPSGGAVCWEEIDCVSWGSFDNSIQMLQTGTSAAAVPDGQSVTRSIVPGCATLLEGADDTNDSATDFAITAPTPRANSTLPTETACTGGGGGADDDPPQTRITKGPKRKTEKTKAKFKFTSTETGSSFECKFDREAYEDCDSPEKIKRIDDGRHKFRVRATDEAGNTDPTPAKLKFRVID